MQKRALIIGNNGIVGSGLAAHLLSNGWLVHGVSRSSSAAVAGCRHISADLTSADSVASALGGIDVSHVFLTAWSRQATEKENIRVNGAMVRNVLEVVGASSQLEHAALVTGLKHYLGPFEAYGKGAVPITPFREEQGRQDVDNFYYEQEDRLFEAAARHHFTWSVHRPHTIIGFAVGNAMNMGTTLAVYATLCKHTGQPFAFPGSLAQWEGLTDMTDTRLLAQQIAWASTHAAGQNQDFNAVNGDIFRWKWMWPRIAEYFGIEAAPYHGELNPLESRMQDAAGLWQDIAGQYQLREADITRLASWWHTDADLGRPMEVVTDMSKSRKAGFLDYQSTPDAFTDLFDRLKAERIIPA
ncbi:SDR family oxidoreductase [Undibacterium sp.]|uniref:SDR family oxidoreductase n=1 Tax=Undibacterium sp. TaxID=1914977 RepID=UPI00374DBE6B